MRFTLFFVLSFFSLSSQSFTIMSYNVENLFDYSDDPKTNDEQFLPKEHKAKKACLKNKNNYRRNQCLRFNWDKTQFEKKVEKLALVINSYQKPVDVLGLIEVENEYVVEQLNKRLKRPFNKVIVAPTSDDRGIRVALLLREKKGLKFSSSKEWRVKVAKRRTRSILQVSIERDKKKYCFFVNHWPSQGSSTAKRVKAAKILASAIEKAKCKVVAMGDFNTLDHENPDPFSYLEEAGLIDLTSKFRKKKEVLGSYFFSRRLAWNFLDRFFVSKKIFKSTKKKDLEIVVNEYNSGVWEQRDSRSRFYGSRVVATPKRFSAGGVSDHFPIVMKLND